MIASAILELSLCLIENFSIFFFLDRLLTRRFRSPQITVLVAILNSFIIFLLPELSYLKIGISIIVIICFCLFLYRTQIYIASVFALIFIYILYIIDVITGNLISLIVSENIISILFDNLLRRLIICIIVKGLDILVFFFVYNQFKKSGMNYERKYWILFNIIMLVFLILTAMFMILYSADPSDPANIFAFLVLSLLFFVMSLIVIYFFTYILESNNRIQKYLILESGYESANENMLLQQDHAREFAKIRHDIKNHLLLAHYMMVQNKYEEADTIITETLDHTESAVFGPNYSSGNSIIDAILAGKAATCRNAGITYNCTLDEIPDLSISALDISSVLSNLLDNAIEAATDSEDPSIEVRIVVLNNYLIIYVKNSFSEHPQTDQSGRKLLSLKRTNTALHGYGTQIIRDIADKYRGSFEWLVDGRFFKATVLLSISEH